jgi:hypothetical protein
MDIDGKSIDAQDIAIAIAKIRYTAADRGQFRGSDEPEIARVKQDH